MRWRNADARPGERPFRRNFASDLASATLPPPPGERDMGERDVASATWASATWRARRHPPTGERHFVIATSRSPSSTKRPIGTSRRCAHEPVRHAPGPIGTAPSARESRPLGRQHPLNTTRARANARVQGHRVCATGARRSTVLASNPGRAPRRHATEAPRSSPERPGPLSLARWAAVRGHRARGRPANHRDRARPARRPYLGVRRRRSHPYSGAEDATALAGGREASAAITLGAGPER